MRFMMLLKADKPGEAPMLGGEAEIEIRQIFEMDDFGDAMTPELRAQEEHQRAALAG